MKIKIVLLALICLLGTLGKCSFGQASTDQLQQKYWFYKNRLHKFFIVQGLGQGRSIPANHRNMERGGIDKLDFGDGLIHHGWYIGVLATEHKLLDGNQRITDLERNRTELYYALEALDRLDREAEEAPPWNFAPSSSNLDGFAIRSDASYPFFNDTYYEWNKYPDQMPNVEEVASDFVSPTPTNKELSQDQVIHLLIGLYLTLECVPPGAVLVEIEDNNGPSVIFVDLHQKAKDAMERLIYRMAFVPGNVLASSSAIVQLIEDEVDKIDISYQQAVNSPVTWALIAGVASMPGLTVAVGSVASYLAQQVVVGAATDDAWLIVNPDGEPVARGGIALAYSPPFKKIYEDNIGPLSTTTADLTSIKGLWQVQQRFPSTRKDNNHMSAALAAMAGNWKYPNNSTYDGIQEVTKKEQDWRTFYQTLYIFLHQTSDAIPPRIGDVLTSAPCSGPHSFTQTKYDELYRPGLPAGLQATPNWACDHKFVRSYEEARDEFKGVNGFHNGLDYMLLHNLFRLTYQGSTPAAFYQNYENLEWEHNFPFTTAGQTIGTTASPYNLNGFWTLTADNDVYSNASVEYKAEHAVTLKPGFKAESGSSFRAHLGNFYCTGQTYNKMGEPVSSYGFSEALPLLDQNQFVPLTEEESVEEESWSSEARSSSDIRLFPNPNTGQFQIEIPWISQSEIGLSVSDARGNQVWETTTFGGESLGVDLSHLASGLYLVKIQTGSEVRIEKVIVR